MGIHLMTSAPLALVEAVPLLGGLAASFLGTITCCASLLISLAVALVIIATAWLFYRPAVSLAILAVAAGAFFLSRQQRLSDHGHTAREDTKRHPSNGREQESKWSGPSGAAAAARAGAATSGRPEPSAPPNPMGVRSTPTKGVCALQAYARVVGAGRPNRGRWALRYAGSLSVAAAKSDRHSYSCTSIACFRGHPKY